MARLTFALTFLVFAVFLLLLRGCDQRAAEQQRCETFTTARADNRSTWLEVREFLNEQNPGNKEATDAFIDQVLSHIPPLECVDGKPKEVEDETKSKQVARSA